MNNFVDGQPINQNKKNIPANPAINTQKINIIKSLILLVCNDKEIIKLYSQGYNDSTKLKKYYLINKDLVNKFRQIYNYNKICEIPEIKGIQNFNGNIKNLNNLLQLHQIKDIYNSIIIDNSFFSQTPIYPTISHSGEYEFPINFVILHESIINMLK